MFWIISALLVLIAFAFILPPLFSKKNQNNNVRRQQNILIANEQLSELEDRFENGEIDEDNYRASRDELELSLFSDVNEDEKTISNSSASLASKFGTFVIIALIPLISVLFYLKIGDLQFTKHINSKQVAAEANKPMEIPRKADGTPDVDKMVSRLKQKMETDPKNAQGWYMLGRSYMVLKRYTSAAESFDRALTLVPKSTNIMLSLADALSMQEEGTITGRSATLINEVLEIEPNNQTALWLGGMASRQSGNSLEAVQRWNKVLGMLENPQERSEVQSLITEASQQLSPELQAKLKSDNTSTSSRKAESAGITVKVSISDKIKDKVSPTDTIFIYAKAISGPPMPLAAKKLQAKDLPIEITLNDQMAMIPSMKLSDFSEVIVGARVSKSGGPIPQNGDLYSEKSPIKTGDKIRLSIDTLLVK